MGGLSSLVDRSIHISIKGIEKDIVFLGIPGVHEVALRSTVKEDWSIDDFVVCWGFAFDRECNDKSHSIV